jgi:dTMP kinase
VYSSLAYQGAGRRLGIAEVRAVNEPGLGKVWPELVILLNIEASRGLERQRHADRIGAEGEAFQYEVAAGFSLLASQEPERFSVVDATLPLEEVVAASLAIIEERW